MEKLKKLIQKELKIKKVDIIMTGKVLNISNSTNKHIIAYWFLADSATCCGTSELSSLMLSGNKKVDESILKEFLKYLKKNKNRGQLIYYNNTGGIGTEKLDFLKRNRFVLKDKFYNPNSTNHVEMLSLVLFKKASEVEKARD